MDDRKLALRTVQMPTADRSACRPTTNLMTNRPASVTATKAASDEMSHPEDSRRETQLAPLVAGRDEDR